MLRSIRAAWKEVFGVSCLHIQSGKNQVHLRKLRSRILRLEKIEAGLTLSNRGGWHSGVDFLDAEEEVILWFRKKVRVAVRAVAARFKIKSDPDFWKVRGWANVSRRGDGNFPHIHGRKNWAGVYYVSCAQEAGGYLVFYEHNPKRPATRRRYVKPLEGDMWIFPRTLWHSVTTYKGADERISVAFNITPQGNSSSRLKVQEPKQKKEMPEPGSTRSLIRRAENKNRYLSRKAIGR